VGQERLSAMPFGISASVILKVSLFLYFFFYNPGQLLVASQSLYYIWPGIEKE